MPIYQEPFGITGGGTPASRFILENAHGTRAILTDFGVTLLSLTFAGKDVVLGYDDLKTYETQTEYFGATVGRFAGPIPNALLQVGEKTFPLTRNMGSHQIHGGVHGFSFRVWDSEILPDAVRFTLFSPHGEEGYPGNLQVSVTCSLTEEDGLLYTYDAVSDADTVLNMTCHAYFNLNGHGSGSVLSHVLQSSAAYCRAEEPAGVPKAEVLSVADTPFDFTKPHPIGENLQNPHPQLDAPYGYDRNLYLGQSGIWKQAALVEGDAIAMEVLTTQSGFQLYCPGIPLENHPGKHGASYQPYGAFCMETQHCTAPGETHLYPTLKANTPYHHQTLYRFSHCNPPKNLL